MLSYFAPGRSFALSTPNVIDAYIRLLRKKVDAGRDRPLIHTVRGVGYTIKG